MFWKNAVDQIRGTEFDPDLIMLYFFPDTWVKSGHGTKENKVLSALDKAFIASEQAYPHTAVQAIELGAPYRPGSACLVKKTYSNSP